MKLLKKFNFERSQSKIEKVPRGIRGEKSSKDMASSVNLVSTIGALASPENEILAKGNNSCKSRSNATKVELDLYYVKTNSYIKFQVNATKDRREKFGKRNFCKGQ